LFILTDVTRFVVFRSQERSGFKSTRRGILKCRCWRLV